MTKREQIVKLAATGKSTREIAVVVYGRNANIEVKMAYVRTALRQRTDGSLSKHDKTYLRRKFGGRTMKQTFRNRWAMDPKFRASHKRAMERWNAKRASSAGVTTQL